MIFTTWVTPLPRWHELLISDISAFAAEADGAAPAAPATAAVQAPASRATEPAMAAIGRGERAGFLR
ncbi:hypothetical protein, partial [Acetobacter fabarum]|uniref:hypothetical protein n=1 Tax=Acetobacter fabarum TaxID=483199 RepID=UPI001C54E56F